MDWEMDGNSALKVMDFSYVVPGELKIPPLIQTNTLKPSTANVKEMAYWTNDADDLKWCLHVGNSCVVHRLSEGFKWNNITEIASIMTRIIVKNLPDSVSWFLNFSEIIFKKESSERHWNDLNRFRIVRNVLN